MSGQAWVILALVILAAIAFAYLLGSVLGNLYRKVGPNEALLIFGLGTGERGRVITNGGAFIAPAFQSCEKFPLELMSFDVAPQQNLFTNQGVALRVEAVTQLKVRNTKESILTAAEQFLSMSDDERQGMIRLVMEGHLRGIVGQLTVEQIVKDPEMVSEKMRTISSADLAKMGLEVVSFTIKEVRDENDYISNMGRPAIELRKSEAQIAAALAQRDTQIQQAIADREAAIAKAQAEQARAEAENVSKTKQAEYTHDYWVVNNEFNADTARRKVQADMAPEIEAAIQQQRIVAEQAHAQEIEKLALIKVAEAEAQRREMELRATIVKAAEAEAQRVQLMADAEKRRQMLEGEGRAAALRVQAAAEAEAVRIRGEAEAQAVKSKGLAEAAAMREKAAAYREYNQAAVLDKVVSGLPEVVRALAEPLAKVDKITIVSTGASGNGNGANLGASRITGDLVSMLAQVPAIVETLTGTRISDLMQRVPEISGETLASVAGDGNSPPVGATPIPASPAHDQTAAAQQPPTGPAAGHSA